MTPWLRRLHKWVGLVIAVQFVLWLGSGMVMSLLDHDTVQGHIHRAHTAEATPVWPVTAVEPSRVIAGAGRGVQSMESFHLDGRPVYRLTDKADVWLVDALSGTPVTVDRNVALSVARKDYTGPGQLGTPVLQPAADLEAREHAGAIWRIPFSDEDATTLYVSARDGRVLERRNDAWRLFDVVWMLHIMDYSGRQNFNNPLVVTMAVGGVWMALTGIWLLFASFRLGEFIPSWWRPRRGLSVYAPDGSLLRSVEAHAGDNVYVALARNGLQLPSNCGGGQSCGLCEVRFRGSAPAPTSADRAHLGESKLKQGYRLACNLPVDANLAVEVPGGAALWTEHVGTVERVTAITPFLREIVIRPRKAMGLAIPPGAYVQVHVPGYRFGRDDLHHPEHHRDDWQALDLPDSFASREPVRRSYSLAMPVESANGAITLLARFSPGRQDRKRHPPGKGSSYLYSLKAGDAIRFSGPFGDFHLKPGHAEKVFIGGGAGMAPLRAMIHQLLEQGASERIHFWYGARNLRDAPYLDEMAALARRHTNFSWHLVLSEEAEHAAGLVKGLVHEATHEVLLKDHPDLQACEFYLCGPPAMLAATRQMLAKLGIPEDRIAFDDFKI
ncbi:NADH:ubiquinone reductase (Na(+)-transporting) subunit F [Aerolutibacter ruishenii]|uniref:Na(+)-translocating NADH:ubiquinone oxidoreductase F subunit n=1 Tax=Aerolutibacter ruishenii TaxID=686800 RepID=A0A562LV44_9GAMM|nr:2Fe-2S iron-sulfur cluster-binding protein [Lysobacter ruishenii]TWI11517.1 Na(+)-translocating NADH:ubiquinone oxidoreductase F subunit [Lysobacter ruishenii]